MAICQIGQVLLQHCCLQASSQREKLQLDVWFNNWKLCRLFTHTISWKGSLQSYLKNSLGLPSQVKRAQHALQHPAVGLVLLFLSAHALCV